MTEDELIVELKRGDRNVQENVYVSYKNDVSAAIKKYVTLQEDVEELTQDVFVKVFRKIDQFNRNSKLKTWIVRIAINTAKNFVESIKKRNETINKTIDITESCEWSSDFCDPEKLLISQEAKNIIIKAANMLPENQKTAFLLFYIEGLSQLEISDIMGKSTDAVESLIQRAKTNFKSLFKKNSRN
jgi:RNA polymerase sigma-70 factor (ECF subfamily)